MPHRIWKKPISFMLAFALLMSSIVSGALPVGQANAAEGVLSVAQAIAKSNDNSSQIVEGYIVGYAVSGPKISTSSFADDTNLVIADQAGETTVSKTLFVQIPKEFRQEFGLKTNPGSLGNKIRVSGSLQLYFSTNGIKNVSLIEKVNFTPEDQTAAVTANPGAGAVPSGTKVSLTTSTVGAAVYYNVYGSGDVYDLYTGPIEITGPTTIKAYAKRDGLKDSPISEFVYNIVANTGIAEARKLAAGETALVQGIVTYKEDTGNNLSNLYIQDNTAGIVVRGQNITAAAGDEIQVQGKLESYNGLLQLNKDQGGYIKTVQSGVAIPGPKILTSADFKAEQGKQYEGQLIQVNNFTIDRNSTTTYYAKDTLGGEIIIYAKNVPQAFAANRTYQKVIGVMTYHTTYGFEIIPRDVTDVVEQELSVIASKPSGGVMKGSEIILSTPANGGIIYYTLDGTDPTQASMKYQSPLVISQETTVKAIVVKDGATSAVYTFTYTLLKESDSLLIHDIQGASHRSPYAGQAVKDVEGIVTFKRDNSNFYIQEGNPDHFSKDGRASDAILVYQKNSTVKIGDKVKVSGTVKEFTEKTYSSNPVDLTTTEIAASDLQVSSSGNKLPDPIKLGVDRKVPQSIITEGYQMDDAHFDPQHNALDFYESLEGMRVEIDNPQIVGPYKYEIPVSVQQDGLNPVISPAGGLLLTETNLNPQRVLVSLDYMSPKPTPVVKTGDRFAEPLVGVIGYSFSNFKFLPERLPNIIDGGLKRAVTSIVQDNKKLTVASFNVENYWNDPSTKGKEKTRKIGEVIVNNLKSPDIIGLMEVQDDNGEKDDGTVDAGKNFETMIQAIKEQGGPNYKYTSIDPEDKQDGGAPGGNIRVGFLYNPERVTLASSKNNAKGDAKTAVSYGPEGLSYNPGRIDPTNEAFTSSRKPLAAEFLFNGEHVVVIANHFNSKNGDQAPYGGVQPPERKSEAQRAKQAALVNQFVRDVLKQNPKAHVMLVGDLNDFQFSKTLEIVKGTQLTNLIDTLPENKRYSYIYEGNSQTLDHILVDNKLAKGAKLEVVHINADFMEVHGRMSDHDPLLAQVDFSGDQEGDGSFKLRVLHTNDTHAHLDNVPRRVSAIKEARSGADNTLLLDAGDVFSGTLYFNKFAGQADLDFMNMMGYDAMTFGNHEFDKGPKVLSEFIKKAQFPFVSSNIEFGKESQLKDLFQNKVGKSASKANIYPAIITEVNGQKIGIFGLTTTDTVSLSSPGENITFKDYKASAEATVKMLQAEGINKIIAVTHLGYTEDQKLAEEVEGIDIIVGGHSHTKLAKPVVYHENSGPTVIVQTGEYGQFLGQLDVAFDAKGVLTSWNGKLTEIDAKDASGKYMIPDDAAAAAKLVQYAEPLAEYKKTVIGKTNVFLDGERGNVRKQETNLGNLMADGMRAKVQSIVKENDVKGYVTIQNGGGIRASFKAGDITLGDLLTVMPFGNNLSALKMTGQEIIAALENGVSGVESGEGRFPQISGMRFYYDSTKKGEKIDSVTGQVTQKGERVVKVQVKNSNGTYSDIDPQGYYIVATNSFMANGGDFYRSMRQAKDAGRFYELNLVDYEVFKEYLDQIGTVNIGIEGRTTDLKAKQTAQQVAAGITTIPAPAKDAMILTLPSVPDGFTVAIKSSDKPGVIATNGTITPPSTSTIVTLVLEVTRISDGTKAETASIQVTVPAKSGTTSPGSGSSSGSGSSPSPSTNPAPVPSAGGDKPGTFTVTPDKLTKAGSGKVLVEVPANTIEVKLPSNTYEVLLQNTLEVKSDKIAMTIPYALIKQLTNQLSENERKGSTILLKLTPLSAADANSIIAKAQSASGASIKLYGQVYELSLSIVSAGGKSVKLTTLDQPITIRLKVTPGINPQFTGVYNISDRGELEHVGGAYTNGEMAAQISHFSKYAVLELTKAFADVPPAHWAYKVIQELATKQIVSGTSETAFEPERSITRAEFTTLLVHALKLTTAGEHQFNDVPADASYATPIAIAYKAGIVTGKGKTVFDPNGLITREEMVTMMMKGYEVANGKKLGAAAKSPFSDIKSVSPWAAKYVNAAAELRLIQGRAKSPFAPKRNATRAESAQVIYNLLLN